jgi:hypothetical protein
VKYMLLHYIDEGIELTEDQRAEVQRQMASWLDEMGRRGVLVHGDHLSRPSDATVVRQRDGEVMVTDGPFAETKEQIAGYDVIECADLDEAIEVASKHTTAWVGSIEVRPFGPW